MYNLPYFVYRADDAQDGDINIQNHWEETEYTSCSHTLDQRNFAVRHNGME